MPRPRELRTWDDVRAAAQYHHEQRQMMYGFMYCGLDVNVYRRANQFWIVCLSCRRTIMRWQPKPPQANKARKIRMSRAKWERYLA